jgi:acyl-CoA thioesterase II
MTGPSANDAVSLPPWDETDLPALLNLERLCAFRFCSRHGDANLNGRSYGGQLLGQAMMAACMSVNSDRTPTMLQFLFLQGSDPRRAVEFEVTVLQEGKRFSSLQVRGTQGPTAVLDASVTFALELDASQHADETTATRVQPESLPGLEQLPVEWDASIRRLGGYSLSSKPSIDFRFPAQQLSPGLAQPRVQFWIKTKRALPESPMLHASAFAYVSDWWLNFSSLGSHLGEFEKGQRIYVSSLNHSIWFHRPFEVDRWLHIDSRSPCARAGRGLSIGTAHDLDGRLVATTTQESLMAFV